MIRGIRDGPNNVSPKTKEGEAMQRQQKPAKYAARARCAGFYSNVFATILSCSEMTKCCGQMASQARQATQADAFSPKY